MTTRFWGTSCWCACTGWSALGFWRRRASVRAYSTSAAGPASPSPDIVYTTVQQPC